MTDEIKEKAKPVRLKEFNKPKDAEKDYWAEIQILRM